MAVERQTSLERRPIMPVLERTITTDQPQAPGGGTPTPANLSANLQAGQNFWDAADDAINRALSGNSEAFLLATRQEGGE
jgi:hypothetical protein